MAALNVFEEIGAILRGHFVFTSGRHGSVYVQKDVVYLYPKLVSNLCKRIADHFRNPSSHRIEVVAAPALGGLILSQWTAYWLGKLRGRTVLAVFAEKSEDKKTFNFNRGYADYIPKQHILVVEDVLTTGGSAKKVVEAIRNLEGEITGLGVLWNRGGVTAQQVGNVPELFALVDTVFESWDETDCPLCAKRVPINTEVGKGREFLIRKTGAGEERRK